MTFQKVTAKLFNKEFYGTFSVSYVSKFMLLKCTAFKHFCCGMWIFNCLFAIKNKRSERMGWVVNGSSKAVRYSRRKDILNKKD